MIVFIAHRSSFVVWALSLVVCNVSFSQPPDSLWTRSYDLGANDFAQDIAVTETGGFLLTGFTTDPMHGDSGTGWLLKLNSEGDSLWYRALPQFARTNALLRLSDGGFAVCGRSENFQALIARGDSAGNVSWIQSRGTQAEFNQLCITQNGGFACCGYRWIDFGSRQDAYVVKYNAAGQFLWQWVSNAAGWDYADGIAEATDSDLLIAGTTVNTPNAALLIRLSANGQYRWTEEYQPELNTFVHSTAVHPDTAAGCYLALAHEQADGTRGFSQTRIAPNRLPLWTFYDMEPGLQVDLRAVVPLAAAEFLYCGTLDDGERCVFLERQYAASDPAWFARFYLGGAEPRAAAALSETEFVVAGSMWQSGNHADVFVLRVGALPIGSVGGLVIRRLATPSSTMRLRWNVVPGAAGYQIYRSSDSRFVPDEEYLIGNTSSTQYDDIDVLNLAQLQYSYVVVATDDAGQGIAAPPEPQIATVPTEKLTAQYHGLEAEVKNAKSQP